MNKVIILLCIVSTINPCYAQEKLFTEKALAISHDRYASAENINLTFRQSTKYDFTFYGGFKYHLNPSGSSRGTIVRSENHVVERFYAENTKQRFGLKLGIEKKFPLKIDNAEAFIFYDFQYGRLMREDYTFLGLGNDTINGAVKPIYEKFYLVDGYYNSFEQHVGVGGRIQIVEALSLKMQAGLGYSLIKGPYTPAVNTGISSFGLFSRMFSIGFEYKLIPKAERGKK